MPRYVDAIQCPVDLDGLVMSADCNPGFLEQNLDVADDILYDAIAVSSMSGWLLRIPVLAGFSRQFRRKLFANFEAFPRVNRIYFALRMDIGCLKFAEIWEDYKEAGTSCPDSKSIQMYNPMKMLANDFRKQDLQILAGDLALHDFILDRIRAFLKSGKKDDVDFSYSLFLPDILNPRFFYDLGEAEQLVVLGNLERYFKFMGKFRTMGPLREVGRKELNLILVLLKHILSCEYPYTTRVKVFAWKELLKEMNRLFSTPGSPYLKMFLPYSLYGGFKTLEENLAKKDVTPEMFEDWIHNADGVFESFELDCTLHNIDAADYVAYLIYFPQPKVFNMVGPLVEFQDDKDKVFRNISSVIQTHS